MVQGCEFFSNGGPPKTSDQRTCNGNEQATSTTKIKRHKDATKVNREPKSYIEEQATEAKGSLLYPIMVVTKVQPTSANPEGSRKKSQKVQTTPSSQGQG